MNIDSYIEAIKRQGVMPNVTAGAVYVSDVKIATVSNGGTVHIVPLKNLMQQPIIASIATVAANAYS